MEVSANYLDKFFLVEVCVFGISGDVLDHSEAFYQMCIPSFTLQQKEQQHELGRT